MHGRLALGLAVAALMTGAPAAQAHEMTWDFAVLVARDYWQQRGYELPCEPVPYLLSDAEDAEWQARYVEVYGTEFDMAADLAACRVLITPYAEWMRTDEDGWTYCAEVAHEFGHLIGLGHDHGGIMDHAEGMSPFGCNFPRQWTVKQGWRKPPRWVRDSPRKVQRLWLSGHVWRAQVVRARWLER